MTKSVGKNNDITAFRESTLTGLPVVSPKNTLGLSSKEIREHHDETWSGAAVEDDFVRDYRDMSGEELIAQFNECADPRHVACYFPRLREELLRRGLWRSLASSPAIWTEEALTKLSSRYTTLASFAQSEPDAYRAARIRSMIGKLFESTNPGAKRQTWTPKTIQDAAITCKTRTEFGTRFPGAYRAARSKGILDKVCKHMPKAAKHRARARTDEEITRSASTYSDPAAFMKGDQPGYQQSVRRGLYRAIAKKNNWT